MHSVLDCRRRRTWLRSQLTFTENVVKFGLVVSEICERIDRQIDTLIAMSHRHRYVSEAMKVLKANVSDKRTNRSSYVSPLLSTLSILLSPVHISNNVEATGNNVEATFDFVERTVRLVAFNNVASTLLLVWTGL